MNLIFTTNWNNKLDCTYFTTLRIQSEKYEPGLLCDIYFKGKVIKKAAIVDIVNFYLKDIPSYSAMLDIGYSKEETISLILKIYKKYNIDFDKKKMSLIMLKTIE